MRKRIGFTVLILIIMGFVYFFGSMKLNLAPRYYYALVTTSSNLNNENINGLKLHHSMKDDWFINKYGKEYGRIDNVLFDYYKLKDGLVIATNKREDKIIRIVITNESDKSLKTNKGIGIGDPIEKVKQLYGDRYYTRWEQGFKIIGYVDGNETLEFWYGINNLDEIRYDISEMD